MSDIAAGGTDEQYEEPGDSSSSQPIDKDLDAKVRLLDTDAEMDFKETLVIIARSWAFIGLFKGRFALKWILNMGALLYPVFAATFA